MTTACEHAASIGWTFERCKRDAFGNAPARANVVIGHTERECFVWTQQGMEWTMGLTEEDVIAVYDPNGERIGG